LSLTAEIARRFLATGTDTASVFGLLLQALLTFLAGSTFTEAGQQRVEGVLRSFGKSTRFRPHWKAGVALGVLLIVLVLRLSLPTFARQYYAWGIQFHQTGNITSAIEHYQRAISLTPEFAVAYYQLAMAYEDVVAYEQAMPAYHRAIELDHTNDLAYNNLARLYLLRQNDPISALELLNEALLRNQDQTMPQEHRSRVLYSFLKNRGWSYLSMQHYQLAKADLEQALALRPDGAAAHCLLAQVLEAQQDAQGAQSAWEDCLRYEQGDNIEAQWRALAQERLYQGERP